LAYIHISSGLPYVSEIISRPIRPYSFFMRRAWPKMAKTHDYMSGKKLVDTTSSGELLSHYVVFPFKNRD
jgi:hypothetical protein